MSMKNNVNSAAGFTLIEVLIALMILAIALTAIMLATQRSIRTTNHLSNKLAAHWVGMNVLSRMQLGLLSLPTMESSSHGESQMLGKTYDWAVAVERSHSIYTQRIFINVRQKGSSTQLEHLIGFIQVGGKRNNEILSK